MFGHEVINNLMCNDSMEAKIKSLFYRRGMFKKCCADIQNAQHFHLGDLSEYDRFTKNILGKSVFWGEFGQDVTLPYPICWIDYTDKKFAEAYKGGMLVIGLKPDELNMYVFSSDDAGREWEPHGLQCLINVNKELSISSSRGGSTIPPDSARLSANICVVNNFRFCPKKDEFVNSLSDAIYAMRLLNVFLLLLNCRNIETEGIAAPTKLNIKRKKKGNPELFSYHILTLKPFGKKQKSIPRHLWDNRLHLCRRHFKIYTAEKPLFGSITGRFLWHAQLRGNNKKGVVMKDYMMDAELYKRERFDAQPGRDGDQLSDD